MHGNEARTRRLKTILDKCFRQHRCYLLSIAIHATGDQQTAEDCVSGAMKKAVMYLHSFDESQDMLKWLLTILSNEIRNMMGCPDNVMVPYEDNSPNKTTQDQEAFTPPRKFIMTEFIREMSRQEDLNTREIQIVQFICYDLDPSEIQEFLGIGKATYYRDLKSIRSIGRRVRQSLLERYPGMTIDWSFDNTQQGHLTSLTAKKGVKK